MRSFIMGGSHVPNFFQGVGSYDYIDGQSWLWYQLYDVIALKFLFVVRNDDDCNDNSGIVSSSLYRHGLW